MTHLLSLLLTHSDATDRCQFTSCSPQSIGAIKSRQIPTSFPSSVLSSSAHKNIEEQLFFLHLCKRTHLRAGESEMASVLSAERATHLCNFHPYLFIHPNCASLPHPAVTPNVICWIRPSNMAQWWEGKANHRGGIGCAVRPYRPFSTNASPACVCMHWCCVNSRPGKGHLSQWHLRRHQEA